MVFQLIKALVPALTISLRTHVAHTLDLVGYELSGAEYSNLNCHPQAVAYRGVA